LQQQQQQSNSKKVADVFFKMKMMAIGVNDDQKVSPIKKGTCCARVGKSSAVKNLPKSGFSLKFLSKIRKRYFSFSFFKNSIFDEYSYNFNDF